MSHPLRFLLLALPVLLLALLTVWLPRVGDSARDPLVEQASEAVEAAPLTPEQRELDQAVSRTGGTFDGHVGIAVRDIEGGRTLHFNGLELFPQQSVSKLWVAMTALDEVDAGRLDLSEMVAIRAADLTVFHQPIRDIVRRDGSFSSDYAELIERAITESDNTANDRLLRRVGGAEAVQDFLDTHGLASIRFGTDERSKQSAIAGLEWRQSYAQGPAFFDARDRVSPNLRKVAFENYLADPVDGATPIAIARALAAIERGEVLSEKRAEELLTIMSSTRSGPRRLKGGRAEGWVVSHKTGTGQFWNGQQSGYNDVGVLFAPDSSAYAVAVMIGVTKRPTVERMEMMQEVTRAVTAFHEALAGGAGNERSGG